MAATLSKNILHYLKKLNENNNREWFNDHKNLFTEAQNEFEIFVEELINRVGKSDEKIAKLNAKKSLLRIYRDIRFSKDKTPYKTYFGASLGMGKSNEKSGHYLHIEPGKSFIASGIYLPEAPVLKEIRKEISVFKDDFLKAIDHKDFKKYYGELDREHELKKIPQGFEKEDPMAEYLKLKSFIGVHHLTDKDVMDKNAAENLTAIMKSAKPLNDFLNTPFSNVSE
ncbi:MAG: hypothetical protein K0R77_2758 [Chryseobacterium sp.]|jgi:uncharacterized protein (TIGR02453 family)|uniref:DUF2461 domain-containing protein n=1 Tax=Chryseobacterium sp. TaxID=1871047 RepID=UPI00261828BC|nr:DUF2461 domain-containing protein [Chryseobacterium sp.]MDF2553483.1 hypothetical protein [Chryseobacterium sp.]